MSHHNPQADLTDSGSDTVSTTSTDTENNENLPKTPFIRTVMNGFIFVTFCSAVWLLIQYGKEVKKTSFKGIRNRISSNMRPNTVAVPAVPAVAPPAVAAQAVGTGAGGV